MLELKVNGKHHLVDVSPDTPLLWVLRDTLGLTGTKLGCGMALCGVCTVYLDGEAIRSCITPVSRAVGKEVVTIEGASGDLSRAVQEVGSAEDVPQGGYRHLAGRMEASHGLYLDLSKDGVIATLVGWLASCCRLLPAYHPFDPAPYLHFTS